MSVDLGLTVITFATLYCQNVASDRFGWVFVAAVDVIIVYKYLFNVIILSTLNSETSDSTTYIHPVSQTAEQHLIGLWLPTTKCARAMPLHLSSFIAGIVGWLAGWLVGRQSKARFDEMCDVSDLNVD